MPRIVSRMQEFPDWCQLRGFSIVELGPDGHLLEPAASRQRLVACQGSVQVQHGTGSAVIGTGQFFDADRVGGQVSVRPVYEAATIVVLSGEWGDELGGCGIFVAEDTATPADRGDPVGYSKSTNIDSHYHDCDEYWILLEGRATVVVGSDQGTLTPGDCLCIGMGHHHDMPGAPEKVKAVYFETSLERGKRVGHLWNHTHGAAVPETGRI